jgi:hypothetical protein
MNAADAYISMESPLRFSISDNLSISNGHMFSFERNEDRVNNYLKTPEEMEAEFCFVINTRRAKFQDRDGAMDLAGNYNLKTDGYMHTSNLDETFSGFMEENY